MNCSLNKIPGRKRSIIWVSIGGFIALAAILCAVAPRVLRFSSDWRWGSGATTADQAERNEGVVETHDGLRPLDQGVRAGASRSAIGASKRTRVKGRAAATVRSDHLGDDRFESGSATNANNDTDAALFSALERLERQMAAAIARARESVVALEYTAPDAPPGTRRVATGVVVNNHGEVLSVHIDPPPASQARMAVGNLSRIVALDFSGHRHSVHWVAADPETGLTLLRLPPRAVRPIRSASGVPNLGSQVFVVGNPFGMGHSVSRGHVAGLDRALELGNRQLGGLIQIHAPLYPGDSGAAVVNLHGDWLGLIRSGLAIPGSESVPDSSPSTPRPTTISASGLSPSLTPTDVSLGRPERDTDFGFAIPVRDAIWVADQLRTGGRVDRAYLGVQLEPISASGVTAIPKSEQRLDSTAIDPASGTALDSSESDSSDTTAVFSTADEGAILRNVLAGTPASQAGLRPGDGIVELDGQPIRSTYDLTDRLDRIPARTTILLGVVRDRGSRRQRFSLSLRTASRPGAPQVVGAGSLAPAAATIASTRATSSPPPDFSLGSGSAVTSPPINLENQTPSVVPLPPSQPNELRLTLPRAVVERIEKLERRLEKLESFPARATRLAPVPDSQISSSRHP
jgi:serine protease Do